MGVESEYYYCLFRSVERGKEKCGYGNIGFKQNEEQVSVTRRFGEVCTNRTGETDNRMLL